MTVPKFKEEFQASVSSLLQLARQVTNNEISDQCSFIFSKIEDQHVSFQEERALRIKSNSNKQTYDLAQALDFVERLYPLVYDFNLQIFTAKPTETIVDVRYYLKESLEPEFLAKVAALPPMLHCKVPRPPEIGDLEKFDVNWEHRASGNGG